MNRIERAARAWARAGLENDFVFSKVMSDPAICLAVIRSILPDLTIRRLVLPKTQQEVNPTSDAKGGATSTSTPPTNMTTATISRCRWPTTITSPSGSATTRR